MAIKKSYKIDHENIWRASDILAEENGMSVSKLAKKSGLDSTTFNKSKRIQKSGKKRWPSMESIIKILNTTNCSMEEFVKHMQSEKIEIKQPNQALKADSTTK